MPLALVVGKPNAGKTLFALNFAAFLGLQTVRWQLVDSDGCRREQLMPIERARRRLVSSAPHKTLQSLTLPIPIRSRKPDKTLRLLDTAGIVDGITDRADVRHAMADTLERVQTASLVLHIVDASEVESSAVEAPGPVDRELAAFCPMIAAYVVLANKMDRPHAQRGLTQIQQQFRGCLVIPVSALTRQGFREVKAFVFRHV